MVIAIWFLIPATITPLMEAAKYSDIEKLREEIEGNGRVNKQGPEGMTALMFSAQSGQAEEVSLLLTAGADPNSTNDYDRTGLTFASRNGYGNIVDQLLTAGADPNSNSSAIPSSFETVGDFPASKSGINAPFEPNLL